MWLYHIIKKAPYHIWIAYVCFPAAANRDKRLLQEQPGPDAERDRQPKEVSNTWNGLVVSCKKMGRSHFLSTVIRVPKGPKRTRRSFVAHVTRSCREWRNTRRRRTATRAPANDSTARCTYTRAAFAQAVEVFFLILFVILAHSQLQ